VPAVDFFHCQFVFVFPDVIKWSSKNVLLLIEKYRESVLLWNAKHQFHYKLKKNDAWEEIASEMNDRKSDKKINFAVCSAKKK